MEKKKVNTKTQLQELFLPGPLGPLRVLYDKSGIHEITFAKVKSTPTKVPAPSDPLGKKVAQEFSLYFAGKLKKFSLPLVFPQTTEFQRKVWQKMAEIPYGELWSYKDLAQKVKSPKAFRAVGMACHRNPFTIVLPCHRVVATNGQLQGYAHGLFSKGWLIQHEQSHKQT